MRSSRSATTASSDILLAVPHLERWLDESPKPPKVMTQWLKRARVEALDASGAMCELLLGEPLGLAPFYRFKDGPIDSGSVWINVSFVRLQADLNAVWMSPSRALPNDETLASVFDLCKDYGMAFEVHPSGRAYVRLEALRDVKLTPLSNTAGVSLDQVMPTGDDATPFIRLINDSQILFHDLAKQGVDPGAEGLWLWGMGALPALTDHPTSFDRLCGQSMDLAALGHWLDLPVITTHTEANIEPKVGDFIEWQGRSDWDSDMNLQALARALASVRRKLRWGRFRRVSLASASRRWRLTSADLWRWS